jgi:transcriptional regulator with XRE-family HTH domain
MASIADRPDDPSDLGRRVAARRRELGLTLEEAAQRAGMAPDYLARVESSSGVVVRNQAMGKLARALQTTQAALLGAGMARTSGHSGANAYAQLVPVDEETCWRFLTLSCVGRLAFVSERGPTVLPVNYRVHDHAVIFRTDTSSHFARLEGQAPIGFEVDRFDEAFSEGWSVFASGHVRRPADDSELSAIQSLGVEAWAGGNRNTYLMLEVDEVTGRQVATGI